MTSPFSWLKPELERLEQSGLMRRRRCVIPQADGKVLVDGRELWNFAGNDYLGLAGDSRVIDAAAQVLGQSGSGARASALVTGRTVWHAELEDRLAEFKQAESAILFPTGFAANVGTICSLVGVDDIIYCDRLNHASLIDGARLSRARFRVYPHGDPEFLAAELKKSSGYRRRMIVTDSLFSMDGDFAPLKELAALAESHATLLLVDEAHATGIYGARGMGLLEELQITSPNLVTVGTLSKGLGAQGGFVTGSRELTDWLWNQARTQMFSTALAPAACAAAQRAIEIVGTEPQRRNWLRQESLRVREELGRQGWQTPSLPDSPIVPVIIGDPAETIDLATQLEQAGVLVAAIRPPTVPRGTSRLRISLSYAHGASGLSALINAFHRVRPQHGSSQS